MHTSYKQEGQHRGLKMAYIDFNLLDSHATVIYLKFIKSTKFYVVKQKNSK